MKNQQSFYNRAEYLEYLRLHCADELADTQGRVVGRETILFYLDDLGLKPGDRVLEIGCGLGRVMQLLKDSYGCHVSGVDICASAIEEIRRNRPHFADRVHVADAADLPMFATAEFDHVIFWGCFELVDQPRALAEASRLTRAEGKVLICSIKNADYLPDDESAAAAVRAYREKCIPIGLTCVPEFESLALQQGLRIRRRYVFRYKDHAARNQFIVDQGGPRQFSECYYVLTKNKSTQRLAA